MKVRIKFSKYGPLKFIGHLDVMRYFQKAIRRANIPIAYSEGFNPHQIMSFAAPLSVGYTSQGEYLDIQLCCGEAPSEKQLQESLQAVMVEGIDILQVQLLPEGERNAMASVAAASWLVTFRDYAHLPEGWKERLEAFYEQETIPVVKKTKKSEREINLKESIYALEIRREQTEDGTLADGVYMLLNASSGENIKPSFVLECFFQTMGCELPSGMLKIHRLELYRQAADDVPGRLVPLIWEK